MEELDILLVEDNDGDVRLVERVFDTRGLPGTLHVVRTGDGALDWLSQRGEFAGRAWPDLVLLDLNLPATGGEELLDAIGSAPRSKRIPVVVLTSSQSDEELTEAYAKGANACLRKPVDPEEFADHVQALAEFWASTAALAPRPDSAEQT